LKIFLNITISFSKGNTEKVRQVQSIHQQILQFINNPTYDSLANAKHFRDMLDRIPVNILSFFFLSTVKPPYYEYYRDFSKVFTVPSKKPSVGLESVHNKGVFTSRGFTIN